MENWIDTQLFALISNPIEGWNVNFSISTKRKKSFDVESFNVEGEMEDCKLCEDIIADRINIFDSCILLLSFLLSVMLFL